MNLSEDVHIDTELVFYAFLTGSINFSSEEVCYQHKTGLSEMYLKIDLMHHFSK